jgi:hypothetical protein
MRIYCNVGSRGGDGGGDGRGYGGGCYDGRGYGGRDMAEVEMEEGVAEVEMKRLWRRRRR